MPERKRSKDGHRETDDILGEDGEISHGGREGGDLSRDIASKDEKKRAFERPAGATRVTDKYKKEDDNG